MKTFLVAILLLVFAAGARSATITAASTSRADVGTAYAATSTGDTLVIPAGSNNWDSVLTISKAIRIQGNGTNSSTGTVIGASAANTILVMDSTAIVNTNLWLTDIQFVQGTSPGSSWLQFLGCNTNNSYIVCTNLLFTQCNAWSPWVIGAIGVMSHCTWNMANNGGIAVYIYHDNWNGHLWSASWSDPVNYGSDKAWYLENCILTRPDAPYAFTDAYRGARYVVRYNDVTHGWWEAHGTESAAGSRGTRYIESYRNAFHGNGVNNYAHNFRSGTAIIFSNSVDNLADAGEFIHLDAYRAYNSFLPYGQANGVNPNDHNDPANPYDTGTATGGATNLLSDITKNWTVNQWAGYQVTRISPVTNQFVDTYSGYILSNTKTQLVTKDAIGVQYESPHFAAGDTYKICRVLSSLDMPGVQDTQEVLYRHLTGLSVSGGVATGTLAGHGFAVNDYITIIQGYGSVNGDTALMAQITASNSSSTFTFSTFLLNEASFAIPGDIAKVNIPYSQSVDPGYEWANTNLDTGLPLHFSIIQTLTILENTNYFNSTIKPGYTPLAYPHPLLGGSAGGSVSVLRATTLLSR